MFCKYCGKECKNLNSLKQHEIRCKLNENKIEIKSNFIEYNKNRIGKKGTNQFIKAKELGLELPKVSIETRKKISEYNKKRIWDEEKRKKHSISMLKAVENNPYSYSINNISGRTKSYDCIDSLGNKIKVKGTWELLVSELLEKLNIKWTNKIDEEIFYFYENKERRYFPDFYLIDYNIYIEVKGYQRDRDLLKWKSINDRLIIIKKNEIKEIKNNSFNLIDKIKEIK